MRLLSRYVVVGAVNTAWGYLLIFAFMYVAGWSPEASNVMGYAIGLVTSFVLNRRFTFESSGPRAREFARFLATFAIAFLANFMVLALMVRVLGMHAAVSQVVAGVVYVATSFLLSKHYVFREAR